MTTDVDAMARECAEKVIAAWDSTHPSWHDATEWWYGAPPMIERLLDRIMGTIQNMMETDET